MEDKVLIAINGGHFETALNNHFNPLGLENVYEDLPQVTDGPNGPFIAISEHFGNYLYALGRLVNCYRHAVDRTDEFNILNVHIDPIPNIPHNWNRTFEEIFLERAEEIWAMDKPIRLWWSGGIDSTTALISLLRTKKSEHKLIIFMSDPCVEENPNFYETLKKMEFNKELTIQWNDEHNIWSFDNWCDGSINITGEPGDAFYSFGPVVKDHIDEINSPWTDLFKWAHKKGSYLYGGDDARSEYHRPRFMEFAEEYNKKCPFEVKNIF